MDMMEAFFEGREFEDFNEFEKALTTYQRQQHVVFTKRSSSTVATENKRVMPGQPKYKDKFVYAYLQYGCKHYGKRRIESKGIRVRQRSYKSGCPVTFSVSVNRKKDKMVMGKVILEHNHDLLSDEYHKYPEVRRVNPQEKRAVEQLLGLNVEVGKIKEHIHTVFGKQITVKDIHNIRSDFKSKGYIIEKGGLVKEEKVSDPGKKLRAFKSKNTYLELNAVRLCQLEKNHRVLEVGFGLGIGLKRAAEAVELGSGKIHGIDFSPEMMRTASKCVDAEVLEGKVELVLGDAAYLPYRDNIMDRIYHCNCYYFWPDVDQVVSELMRVLKPGGFMVTTMNMASSLQAAGRSLMKNVKWDPEAYMDALKRGGFIGVEMLENYCEDASKPFHTIFAHKQQLVDS